MTIPMTFRRARATANRRRQLASGFTLMEILIAIALIVTIVAVAVTNLTGILNAGQADAAKLFVTQEINTPLMTYKLQTGTYPTTEQGLMALIQKPDGISGWNGPYLQNETSLPVDPWKQPYHYAYPSTHNQSAGKYDVWSSGPDGVDGSPDDIGNWQN